jgi:hypothetical protein
VYRKTLLILTFCLVLVFVPLKVLAQNEVVVRHHCFDRQSQTHYFQIENSTDSAVEFFVYEWAQTPPRRYLVAVKLVPPQTIDYVRTQGGGRIDFDTVNRRYVVYENFLPSCWAGFQPVAVSIPQDTEDEPMSFSFAASECLPFMLPALAGYTYTVMWRTPVDGGGAVIAASGVISSYGDVSFVLAAGRYPSQPNAHEFTDMRTNEVFAAYSYYDVFVADQFVATVVQRALGDFSNPRCYLLEGAYSRFVQPRQTWETTPIARKNEN